MYSCWTRCRLAMLLAASLLPSGSAWAQFGPANVVVSPVVQDQVKSGQTFVGTVRPTRVSVVGAAVAGRVRAYPINEGDRVNQGDTLAQLRTRTLELERDAAKKTAEALHAEFLELKNGSRPDEVKAAEAARDAASAAARYAKLRFERTRRLFEKQRTATLEEFQEAISLNEQAQQQQLQAEANWRLVEDGPREERIRQAEARWQSQEALVQRFNDRIDLHRVQAPFTGFVSVEHSEAGQWVKEGDLVAEIVELEYVDVEVQVVEDVIDSIRLEDTARVEIPAIRDVFEGKIVAIVPQADPRARTFPVKIRVKNQMLKSYDGKIQPLLKSNMFARAILSLGQEQEAILVAKDAVVLGGPRPMVFVATADAKDPNKVTARPVPVELGVAQRGLIEIKGNLQPGDKVVVQGNERLRPGMSLAITKEISPGAAPPPSLPNMQQ